MKSAGEALGLRNIRYTMRTAVLKVVTNFPVRWVAVVGKLMPGNITDGPVNFRSVAL